MTSNVTRRALVTGLGSAALASRLPLLAAAAKPLQGAFMILFTPYTESKAVDYEDLAGQVDFLHRCGAHGIVWPQLGSEYTHLTKEERLRGMETLARAVQGKKPALVLGVQGEDTASMLEYTAHAEKLAPDAVIAIPPTKAKSEDDYRSYFRALCKATSRPIFIQTSGGAPKIRPSVELILELSKEFPNFGYVKEEHEPVLERMKQLIAHRPDPVKRVFGARHGVEWMYEMRLGGDGTINTGVMYGDIYARLWELHVQNKPDELRELFGKLLLMLNLDHEIPGVRLYLLKKRGIFKTTVSRQAEYKFTPEQIAEIEYNYAALKPYLRA